MIYDFEAWTDSQVPSSTFRIPPLGAHQAAIDLRRLLMLARLRSISQSMSRSPIPNIFDSPASRTYPNAISLPRRADQIQNPGESSVNHGKQTMTS